MKSIILAIGVLFFVGPAFADTISCNNFENATYEGNKLHWKNVYTGNNYNVHVTKQQ